MMKQGFLGSVLLHAAAGLALVAAYQQESEQDIPEAKPEILEAVERICESDAPLLIVDAFSAKQPDFGVTARPTVDMNGDEIDEIAHGDLTEKVAQLTGKKTISYGLVMDATGRGTSDLEPALQEIFQLIEGGIMPRPAALILSLETRITISDLREHGMEITPVNAGEKEREIVEILDDIYGADDWRLREYRTMQQLIDKGIPMVTAAGNGYSENSINLLGAFNTITVGALTYTGDMLAAYSNDNGVTDIYRTGDMIIREVADGIDINDDGVADFPQGLLSNGKTLTNVYNGLDPAVAVIPAHLIDAALAGKIKGIIPAEAVAHAKNASAGRAAAIAAYGGYVYYPSLLPFRTDEQGMLVFDPAHTKDTSQINFLSGTSLAAPNICGR